MSAHHSTSTRRRPLALGIALGSAVLAAGVVSVAASSAATTETASASPAKPSDADRKALTAELTKARSLKGDDRREALASIWADARSGKYGEPIAARAERRVDQHLVMATLPKDMRRDLAKIRKSNDKDAARQAFRRHALDGDYGKRVQAAAKRMDLGED